MRSLATGLIVELKSGPIYPIRLNATFRSRTQSSLLRHRYYSSSSEAQHVAILGAGVTGLATAYYLSKAAPTTKITIYEASPRLGGWLNSERVPLDNGVSSVLFEAGPRTLRNSPNGVLAIRLVRETRRQTQHS